jgi:hypothetical protein
MRGRVCNLQLLVVLASAVPLGSWVLWDSRPYFIVPCLHMGLPITSNIHVMAAWWWPYGAETCDNKQMLITMLIYYRIVVFTDTLRTLHIIHSKRWKIPLKRLRFIYALALEMETLFLKKTLVCFYTFWHNDVTCNYLQRLCSKYSYMWHDGIITIIRNEDNSI